jgi:hypothetical protein
MPVLGIIASSRLGAPADGYVSLASFTATGGESEIVFSNILQQYQHLEIRYVGRNTAAGGNWEEMWVQFNGVTSANYSQMAQGGFGGTLFANGGTTGLTRIYAGVAVQGGNSSGLFAGGVIRIPNYTSTTQYKHLRGESTWSASGQTGAIIQTAGGLWSSTAAITSLRFTTGSSNWAANSKFALYGIK